jgi:hypothetical protein
MRKFKHLGRLLLVPMMTLIILALIGCGSSSTTTEPGTGSGLIPENDSIVTTQINSFRASTLHPGYPTEIDLRVISSQNVGDLMNPTIDKIDRNITAYSDQDPSALDRVRGTYVNAHIKRVGENLQNAFFYIYDMEISER